MFQALKVPMAKSSLRQLSLLLLLILIFLAGESSCTSYSRLDFPSDFVFGAGTSAYQYEGAVADDGRKPSIWDTFTHAGKMPDKTTGDVASDGYHKYKEDVELMYDLGLDAYKFSISWSRLIPDGRGAINHKGLKYYNNLINEMVKRGIKPHVTLYHGDLPQALQDEYGGWLNSRIVEDFKEYADTCFREFGDRVSHWTTFAEPNIMAMAGYDTGEFAPGRCSYPFGYQKCTAGNSTTEPYIAVHNILLTHAQVVKLYRGSYQADQKGLIGLSAYSIWHYPLTSSSSDIEATQRVLDFMIGWILKPLVYGDYPEIMKKNVGQRLPCFTLPQLELVKGSFDFISLNHYTSSFVSDNANNSKMVLRDYKADMFAKTRAFKNETSSKGHTTKMLVDPMGLKKMLEYLKESYGNPPVYIEENGYGLGVINRLNDTDRIEFLRDYIGSMLDAMRNGANVKGYFVWSLVDLFEFLCGYKSGYGLYHVDFNDEKLKRVPKLSAQWYSNFLTTNTAVVGMKENLHASQ